MDVGILSYREMVERGLSRSEVDAAVQARRLVRIRRGWYALPDANQDAVRALQIGARLGCVSGAKAHGLWVPPIQQLHVVISDAVPVIRADGAMVHRVVGPLPDEPVCSARECIEQVLRRHDTETGLIVLESAVNLGHLGPTEARALIAAAPAKQRGLTLFRTGAQSGTETRVRLYFQRRGIPVRTQVSIPTVGRVDLLVGESLIVECDSQEFHSTHQTYSMDRRRDLAAAAEGYRVLRLSYQQVMYEWTATQQVLAGMIQQRLHRRRRG